MKVQLRCTADSTRRVWKLSFRKFLAEYKNVCDFIADVYLRLIDNTMITLATIRNSLVREKLSWWRMDARLLHFANHLK